jgi:NAD-dependent SIR2 family protein deacetylase
MSSFATPAALARLIAMVADASAPQNVVVLTGAGLSCASGIPDFRSPGGLYATLQPDFITATEHQRQLMKDNPTAVVDIRLFAQNPFPYLEVRRPFILGTMERKWQPTLGHFFIKVLADRNKLRRLYTQNIDGLDAHAGVPDELLVNVHGSLGSTACEFCKRSVPYAEFADEVKHKIRNIYDAADASSPTDSSFIVCKNCGKPQVKPATVLYGTQLPPKFF